MAKQLPAMQDMFAEAFTSLRDRIAIKLSGGGVGFGGASSSSTGVSGASRKSGQKKSPGGGSAASKRRSHDPLADLLGGPLQPSLPPRPRNESGSNLLLKDRHSPNHLRRGTRRIMREDL